MKNSIVWLASYPKSGNTWTRIFLANYMMNSQQPLPINQAHRFAMGDATAKMYHMVGGQNVDTGNIELTLALRDKVLRGIIANNADVNLVKTHNRRSIVMDHDLIPEKYTRSAIYILRNPLDMVLSYARHYGISHDEAVTQITHHDNANAPTDQTVAQFLGSWSDHVSSWTTGPARYPVLALRYEDLLADPHTQFACVIKHLGLPNDADRLDRAIRFSSFDELSSQEKEHGFVERSEQSDAFFGKGQKGQWQTDLESKLVKRIRKSERKTMKKFGYLE